MHELVDVRLPHVELPALDAVLGHPRRGVRGHGEKGVSHASIDLIATGSDARANRSYQIDRRYTHGLYRRDRGFGDGGTCSTPARMHGGHHATLSICDED